MIFVDTNYWLRFLLEDVDKQHQIVKRLLRDGATGKLELITSIIVWFEVYWVLSSFYNKQKSEIVRVLDGILKMKFVKINNRDLLQEALDVYADASIDLEDAYNLVYARQNNVKEFGSFDKKLIKLFKAN